MLPPRLLPLIAAIPALLTLACGPALAAPPKAKPRPLSPVAKPAPRPMDDQSFLFLDSPSRNANSVPNYIGLSNSRAASPIGPLMLGQDQFNWLVRP